MTAIDRAARQQCDRGTRGVAPSSPWRRRFSTRSPLYDDLGWSSDGRALPCPWRRTGAPSGREPPRTLCWPARDELADAE